jgi:glycerophosphoryl diester phosphodiesterase
VSPALPFVIIAHRGSSSDYPENTYRSFDAAIDEGFRHLECDVQLSADGIPVVIHDGNLERVCT